MITDFVLGVFILLLFLEFTRPDVQRGLGSIKGMRL